MTQSVASVTVAYNSVKGLPRQIDALMRQKHRLDEIIVVDSASTDGTSAMLAERYPQVTVLRMPENLGQAGGWSLGLSYAALSKRHDWVWSFDDDSVPAPEALETLLSGIDSLGETNSAVGLAAPMPIHRKTGSSYLPFLWRNGFVRPSPEVVNNPMWFADLVIASGCLVRRAVVERLGLPRGDFFMDFCDFEYCLRIRSSGYKIVVINRVELDHEIGNARTVRFLGAQRLWMNQPPFREYYFSRNLTYLAWWLYPNGASKRSVMRLLVSRMGGVVLFSSRKFSCLIGMVQGFHDGLRGRLGIRLRPDADHLQARSGVANPAETIEAGKA
jgi:GT2 family glycosyltransferase